MWRHFSIRQRKVAAHVISIDLRPYQKSTTATTARSPPSRKSGRIAAEIQDFSECRSNLCRIFNGARAFEMDGEITVAHNSALCRHCSILSCSQVPMTSIKSGHVRQASLDWGLYLAGPSKRRQRWWEIMSPVIAAGAAIDGVADCAAARTPLSKPCACDASLRGCGA